jgi:hypothetical protein
MPEFLNRIDEKLLNAGKGGREEAGLGARKQNVEEYTKAVTGAAELPKAPPVQMNVDKVNKNARFGSRPGEKRIPISDMIKPLGSFKKGTDYVPKTGNYKLHEGEKVVPKEENMAGSAFGMVPGNTEDKPKKEIHEIRTRKAKTGGFIHEHHHTRPEHHKMDEHTSADVKGMLSHMNEHMGDGGSLADAAAPAQAAAAPAAGATPAE